MKHKTFTCVLELLPPYIHLKYEADFFFIRAKLSTNFKEFICIISNILYHIFLKYNTYSDSLFYITFYECNVNYLTEIGNRIKFYSHAKYIKMVICSLPQSFRKFVNFKQGVFINWSLLNIYQYVQIKSKGI